MSSARAGFGDMPDFFLQYPAQAAFFDGLDRMNEAVSAGKAGRFEEAEAKAKEGIRQVLLRARPSSDWYPVQHAWSNIFKMGQH